MNLQDYILVLALLLFGTRIASASSTGTPCLMQNGCVCNSSQVTVVQGKTYGTCTSCYPLFSGPTCADRSVQCWNNGQEIQNKSLPPGSQGTCQCLPQYSGPKCESNQCINSNGGAGPFKILAKNHSNMCGACSDGNFGLFCNMCKNDKGCANSKAGPNSKCITHTPIAQGDTKSFQCPVPDYFVKLLGGEAGNVVIDCQKPGGFRDSTQANGTCAATIYRTEKRYQWQDPFFSCAMFNCTMDVQTVETISPSKGYSNHLDGIWWVGTVLCLSLSSVLVLNGRTKSPHRKRVVLIATFTMLAAATCVFVAAAAASMHAESPNRKKVEETVVDYNCKYTNCSCSKDPKRPYTGCAGTPFGKGYIHILKGPTKVRCLLNATNCTVSLGNFPIKSTCTPSECLAPGQSGSGSSSYDKKNGTGSGGSSSSDRLVHLGGTEIVFTCCILGAIGLGIHYYLSKKASSAANAEFIRRFGDINAGGTKGRKDGSDSDGNDDQRQRSSTLLAEASREETDDTSARVEGGTPGQNRRRKGVTVVDDQGVETSRARGNSVASTSAESELRTPRLSVDRKSLDEQPGDLDDVGYSHDESDGLVSNDTSASPKAGAGTAAATHSAYILDDGAAPGMSGISADQESREEAEWSSQPKESVLSIDRLCYMVDADEDHHVRRPKTPSGSPTQQPPTVTTTSSGGSSSNAETDDDQQMLSRVNRRTGKKNVLKDVSFSVASGEMLALMGPSGAGKTSLLDLISMRSKSGTVEGSIFLDEYEITNRPPPQPQTANSNSSGDANNTTGSAEEGSSSSAPGGANTISDIPMPAARKTLSVKHYKSLVGYVSQEDTLLASLTVYQAVVFAARFKLPAVLSNATIHDLVLDVLHTLKLGHCVDTVIGDEKQRGLSGGEKRRVSIAMELVGRPKILFLDEPTSGLDSCSAMHVMEAISAILKQGDGGNNNGAGGNRNRRVRDRELSSSSRRVSQCAFFNFKPIIIFSIHQPSLETFQLFDKIVLLAKGSILGFGPAHSMVSQLIQISGYTGTPTVHNPADFLLRMEDQLSVVERRRLLDYHQRYEVRPGSTDMQDLASGGLDRLRQRQQGNHQPMMVTRRFYNNSWQKLGLLAQRTWLSMLGSYYLITCHYLVTILLSVFMSALYQKEPLDLAGALNRAGSMSFLLLVVGFISISSTETFLGERRVFLHEREGGFYSSMPYYLPKLFLDFITLRITPIIILGAVIYFSMGFRTDDSMYFLWYLLLLFLFSVTVTAMIICIAMVSPSFGVAALFSSIVLLWQFVFGGMMVQASTIPSYLRWTSKASPFFLAFEPLMVNELNGQHCTFAPRGADGTPTDTNIPILCVQYLANLGLKPDNFSMDVSLLVFWCVFYIVLGWFLLAYFVTQRK